MNLGFNLNMDMRMEQRLTPQMIQSLKLLQVSSLELEMLVKQEMEQNPCLEIDDAPEERIEERTDDSDWEIKSPDELEETPVASTEEARTDIDWESYFDDGFETGTNFNEERSDEEAWEATPVHQASMEEFLLAQIQEKRFDEALRPVIEYLIGGLNENGFLETTREELQKKFPFVDEAAWEEALNVLQHLDPPGIGARDLRESLQIQLVRAGRRDTLAWRIVAECFGLLQKLKIPTIARRLDTTPEEIQAAIREIGSLEPRPGRSLSVQPPPAVIPDLIVEKALDGSWMVLINDKTVPSLRVSRSYQDMIRRGSHASADEKKYVREKLNSASWLVRSIEQRKSTMQRVMHAIIECQPEFFEKGPGHLRPLVLQTIADKVKMHISTVSRVTNEKYVQTPHGVFELKSFFSAAVVQEDGTEISSVEARDAIQKLIETEDPETPLSDQKIVDELKKRGMDVARRTVAKYRDMMGILPARMRRKF